MVRRNNMAAVNLLRYDEIEIIAIKNRKGDPIFSKQVSKTLE